MFEGRHVELLGGELYEVTKNPPHNVAVTIAAKAIRASCREASMSARRRRSSPGAMPMGVAGGPSRISRSSRAASATTRDRHPQVADIVLLAEVTDSSPQDRTVKLAGYAQAGLMVYWILDLGLPARGLFGPDRRRVPGRGDPGRDGVG